MKSQTFRITTLPNSYINWVEKSKFGFSRSYSYDVVIRGEKIESGEKCDIRHYNRIKASAQLMSLGSYRQMYRSTFNAMCSTNVLKYASLFKNTFLAESNGGNERSNLNLIFLPASWNDGTTDYNGNKIIVKSITLRAESMLSKIACLKYEYATPGRVGIFKEILTIEPTLMDNLIRFARLGVLCGMENRRVLGYIEFNNPIEIINLAHNMGYIELLSDSDF